MKTATVVGHVFGTICLFSMTLALGGCQTTNAVPVTKLVERKFDVPKSLLTCSPEPVAGTVWVTQRDVARYLVKLAADGQDCRVKLAAVERLLRDNGSAGL